jgi:hypothetical protein
METYIFQGRVLPERAQLSFDREIKFLHYSSHMHNNAKISVILNQVIIWIDSEEEWDIFDLRNIVIYLVQSQLNIIGFLKGYYYEFEVTRVINSNKEIDYVFGIDIPCISERNNDIDFDQELKKLFIKTNGLDGMFISRCLSDLSSAMKNAEDTGFYCYRAIESLRHHCTKAYSLPLNDKSIQWEKFREVSRCDRANIDVIKKAADPLRHGEFGSATAEDRKNLFLKTWNIVESYLANITINE